MLPPRPQAHQTEPELLSAEAPSVPWKVPWQPMNHRAGVLGKLEGEAAHRTAPWISHRTGPLDLTEADSWVHLTTWVTLPAPSLPEGPLPWPEASHPTGPAPQLPSKSPFPSQRCAPPLGLCEGRLSRHPKVQEERGMDMRGRQSP